MYIIIIIIENNFSSTSIFFAVCYVNKPHICQLTSTAHGLLVRLAEAHY